MSIQIRNLEAELQAPLLRRTTRIVEVTDAGRAFYAEAKDVLARVEAAGKHVRDIGQGVIGTLRVAFLSNVATADLGGRMRRFREQFPGVNLTLMEAPSHAQIAMLRRGDIDVSILRVSRLLPHGRDEVEALASEVGFSAQELVGEAIGREPMVVAVPADSVLAGKANLSWPDFHGEAMIGTADIRERYLDAFFVCCERVGARPVISQHAQDLMTRLWLVACGFGFSPTSASSQEIRRHGLTYRPLPPDGPEVLTFAAWRKGEQSAHLRHFVDVLRSTPDKIKIPD